MKVLERYNAVVFASLVLCALFLCQNALAQDTLPPLPDGATGPQDFTEMWAGFDPRAEPLETEVIHEWEEEGVVMRVVRFRIGIFKGQKSTLAAIYGFPRSASGGAEKIPGLLQIHGGGQYAHSNACLTNARRGYATLSIAWAGRISAPGYHVNGNGVRLFWERTTDDPEYRLTTDWGALDGYHAPSRHPGTSFPSVNASRWTIDPVESPRNSPWFICALAARRALTFLEQQPEVDPERLGVYGHSMGGKLTVMTSVDPRVKAAAPSCGGISDRDNESELFRATIGDEVSLREVRCPVIFLSPSNDFHGRIGDLPAAVTEIQSAQWRVTCSPHHNHQDTPEYEVATQLWFDQHLFGRFQFPETPESTLDLNARDGVPVFSFTPDASMPIRSVGVFYTQQGKDNEDRFDRENTMSRFWRYAPAVQNGDVWTASLPLSSTDDHLWVYGNVVYDLEEAITGAGYYFAAYETDRFNLSSMIHKVSPGELESSGAVVTLPRSSMIESFEGDWRQSWYNLRPDQWSISTHKIYDRVWAGPEGAQLSIQVRAAQRNKLVVLLDDFTTEVEIEGGDQWQDVRLSASDFSNHSGESLQTWEGLKTLKLSPAEDLRPGRGRRG